MPILPCFFHTLLFFVLPTFFLAFMLIFMLVVVFACLLAHLLTCLLVYLLTYLLAYLFTCLKTAVIPCSKKQQKKRESSHLNKIFTILFGYALFKLVIYRFILHLYNLRLSGFQFLAIGLPPASPCSSEISPVVSVQ